MRISAAIAAAAIVLAITAIPLTPAQAAPAVRFTGAQYDSPGDDTGTNASLNAEWVRIKNTSSRNRNLTDWTVRDPQGHVFRFPEGYVLRSGRSVRIHTGSGSNSNTDLYWRQDNYVWNNSGDRAILRNAAGDRVDVCTWNDGDGFTSC